MPTRKTPPGAIPLKEAALELQSTYPVHKVASKFEGPDLFLLPNGAVDTGHILIPFAKFRYAIRLPEAADAAPPTDAGTASRDRGAK